MKISSKILVSAALGVTTVFGFSTPAEAAKLIESVVIGENFTGTTRFDPGTLGFIPPDTMGAVGPDHIVELINGTYAVYDKGTNGLLAQPRTSLDQFWINAGVTPAGSFSFDPRILYDPFSSRWYATAVDNAGNANNFLVAASIDSNPLNGWTAVSIDSDTDNSHWADFPTLGINADNLFISANMFPLSGSGVNTTILEVDKDTLDVVGLEQNLSPNSTGFSVQPVVDMDNTSDPHPAFSSFSSGVYRRSDINNGAVISDGNIFVPGFTGPPLAQQPGIPDTINTSNSRFSSNLVLKDGWVWGVHSIEVGGRSGLRWFKIDEANNTVVETGDIFDPNLDFYYGSIAVNDWKEVVIGFSCSGEALFVSSCAVVGQNIGGSTVFDDFMILEEGTATYEVVDGIGRNRWGDYSATVLDPEDPLTFWTFQEIATGSNRWSIQVTEIKLAKAPEPSSMLALLGLGTLGALTSNKRKSNKDG
ncbi:PEP-CTERM sorting domain-containing protein [Okeania sp. KiyG1]|uniref:PEP-CTERM sorting domain-containing protein n=1 Tax=Okeania sp. KiyG1 TaxID=2720165 RepID=UPI0019236C78|nr:PEP-CTERM sorting domain-containing protein [Okeania sp. KiyG1]GGA06998.1 hypothetical protein CYANOKiyG1_19430 [Okeania sp. KiyG1]